MSATPTLHPSQVLVVNREAGIDGLGVLTNGTAYSPILNDMKILFQRDAKGQKKRSRHFKRVSIGSYIVYMYIITNILAYIITYIGI